MNCEFPTNSNKCFYVCKHSLNMIKVNKIPTFYIPKNILGNVVIEYVKKLNVFWGKTYVQFGSAASVVELQWLALLPLLYLHPLRS